MKAVANSKLAHLALIILASIAVRIPEVYDDNMMVDADEAVIGIMANHWMNNGEFPLFFQGQQYGLSTFEVLFTSMFNFFIEPQDVALKWGALTVWLIGLIFGYLAKIRIRPKQKDLALILILILAVCPTWLFWGMKARGGYITAFTITSLSVYISTFQNSNWKWILCGLSMGILAQANMLFFLGIFAYMIVKTIETQKRRYIGSFVISLVSVFAIFIPIKKSLPDVWSPELIQLNERIFGKIQSFIPDILHFFGGTYYLGDTREMTVFGWFFSALMLIGAISIIIHLSIKMKKEDWRVSPNTGLLLGLIFCLIVPFVLMPGFRYFLPIPFLMALTFFSSKGKNSIPISITILGIAIISSTLGTFKNDGYKWQFETGMNKTEMNAILSLMNEQNIEFGFCPNGLSQWQIMYYAEENITLRYMRETDRYPEKVMAVNNAYENGVKTGLLLFKKSDRMHFQQSQVHPVNDRIAMIINPSPHQLKVFGFEF